MNKSEKDLVGSLYTLNLVLSLNCRPLSKLLIISFNFSGHQINDTIIIDQGMYQIYFRIIVQLLVILASEKNHFEETKVS